MSHLKDQAIQVLNSVNESGRLHYEEYSTIFDGLDEIDTLQDRDGELEALWAQFADVPVDPETDCIEDSFMGWMPGTHREEIWHWFDQRCSKGVAYLLYGDGIDRTDQIAKAVYLKQLCIECKSQTCRFNHGGECRFAMVHERKPRITDDDDCIDYAYQIE